MISMACAEALYRCERLRIDNPIPRIRITNPKINEALTVFSTAVFRVSSVHLLEMVFHFIAKVGDICI